MGHTLLCELGLFLLYTLLYKGHAQDAVLTTDPYWSPLFTGESVTFICDMKEGRDTDWNYKINKDGREFNSYSTHQRYTLKPLSTGDSGGYQCCGRLKRSYQTKWSNTVTLTVSDKPRATLTAGPTTIPVGGRVTLTCSVETSAGWKYEWFRRTTDTSEVQVRTNDGENKVISVSQGGIYRCRGGRGEPVYYTDPSDPVTTEITFSNKAVITRQPNWPQIFRGEKITLTCEVQGGEDTEWKYEWRPPRSSIHWTFNKYWTFTASESSREDYMCKSRHRDDSYSSTEWSEAITLSVSATKPKAQLSADTRDIPVGGSVTLTCSVQPSSGWKYYWYRDEKSSEHAGFYPNGQTRVSQEGLYWCRGGRGDPVYYTEYSDSIRINRHVPNKVTVTLQPNWPQINSGEEITLRCEIHGGDTEWEYEWTSTSSYKPPNLKEFRIKSDSSLHTGDYKCKGRMKSGQQSSTEWSDSFRLTVFIIKLQPVLSVSPSWLSPGASVTLSCELEHPSAGWRFYWYKAVPDLSHKYPSYNYELLPGSINGTEQDSYIIDGQTHTAGYVCRAGRGDPVFYTDYSQPRFVWSGDFHSAASLSVNPDRVQHFTSDSVSLSCEGNSTEWRVRSFPEDLYLSCSDWKRMTEFPCKLSRYQSNNAVYWCESGSGEFSNAVNITGHGSSGIILVSPVHPVTEGEPVTLSCRFRQQQILSNVFFYHNDKLIQNDTRGELSISAVSKTHEGFYKCEHSGKQSPQSWIAVKRAQSSSSPVPLITGLLCGIILIILLLLLYRYRRSKGSATDQTVNQDEHQHQVYSSLLHADVSVYESIRGSGNTGSGEPDHEYRNIPSHLQLQGRHDTEKSSDYNNVNPESLSCVTSTQSQRTSQIPATVQTVNQDENQQHIYSSLLHGDACVYESIRAPENTANVGRTDGCRNVKSQTELRDVGRRSP